MFFIPRSDLSPSALERGFLRFTQLLTGPYTSSGFPDGLRAPLAGATPRPLHRFDYFLCDKESVKRLMRPCSGITTRAAFTVTFPVLAREEVGYDGAN